ncbi:MAG: LamG domain-containing protein, partial [Prevotellaceae bacterium]|nr:LamG domain-containing protein [Prevotellaceae bacterium]
MKKILYYISKRAVWVIPVLGCWFLTGMGYNPTDESGNADNDKTVAYKENIIARWSFDASSPGRNSVSDNYHARVGRKVAIVPGIKGSAVKFSPGNAGDMSVEIAHDVLPAGLSEFTFSAWIAPETFGEHASIICKEDIGVHGENRLVLAVRNHGKFLALGINCGGNYAECNAPVSSQELCDGKWHHAAGTFDGHMMRVYLDGKEIGSFERQAPLSTVYDFAPVKTWRDDIARSQYNSFEESTVRGVPMYIGSSNGKDNLFNGKIDDVRFYSQALDEQTVAKLCAEGGQSLSASLKQAQETAKTLYAKGNSFIETLGATDRKLMQQQKIGELVVVELHRLLRDDYPAETNAYIMKWKKNPLDNLLLSEKERRSRAENLATAAFEYLPLTNLQWSVLSEPERAKWERVKQIRSQFDFKGDTVWIAGIDKSQLGTTLYEMENLVEERPRYNERVAPYIKPHTPKTVDRTADEALKVIHNEWLFQCDGKPTVQRTLNEIKWARKLAARLNLNENITKDFIAKF